MKITMAFIMVGGAGSLQCYAKSQCMYEWMDGWMGQPRYEKCLHRQQCKNSCFLFLFSTTCIKKIRIISHENLYNTSVFSLQ